MAVEWYFFIDQGGRITTPDEAQAKTEAIIDACNQVFDAASGWAAEVIAALTPAAERLSAAMREWAANLENSFRAGSMLVDEWAKGIDPQQFDAFYAAFAEWERTLPADRRWRFRRVQYATLPITGRRRRGFGTR